MLTGTAAALYAGPALTISFVLAAIACGLVGLCYAELSTLLPVQGSTYTYTYATLGELVAWLIGWDLILEYAMGVAAVARGWSAYFNSLLVQMGMGLPPELLGARGGPIANVPAAAIVIAITLLLIAGTRESVRLNNVMVAVKLVVVLAFVVVGAAHVNTANWHPYIPPNTGEFGHFGIRASCAAPRSCSSPTLVSTPSPTAPRRHASNRATYRSASWARWRSRPCSTSPWPPC